MRYLDGNQAWQSQWPPPGLPQGESLTSRPVAVELIIEFKDWGRIRRLIEVAGLNIPTVAHRTRGMAKPTRRGVDHRAHPGGSRHHSGLETHFRWISRAAARHRGARRGASPAFRPGCRGAGRRCARPGCAEQRHLHHAGGALGAAHPALPITPQDDPEGEPIGTLQGALEDMQGRFNLNSLGRMIHGPETRKRPVQDPQPLAQFQRLLSLGRARAQVGGDRARLDRCRRYSRKSRRRRRPDLYLADSALPHRQLPHDVAQRIDEHAGIRRGSIPPDCALRDRPARRDRTDQYLHGVRACAR